MTTPRFASIVTVLCCLIAACSSTRSDNDGGGSHDSAADADGDVSPYDADASPHDADEPQPQDASDADDAIADAERPDASVTDLGIIPGLRGFGTDTRGPYELPNDPVICIVTNLSDGGDSLDDGTRNGVPVKTGSLRQCIGTDPGVDTGKFILFEVSGTINATHSPYYYRIDSRGTAIYGQTAPSPGVTLRNVVLTINASDVVVQHLRVRVGGNLDGRIYHSRDGIVIGAAENDTVENVIVDHCSVSWSVDENINIYENHPDTAVIADVTIANCIISEGLRNNIHEDGPHAKGMQVGGNGSDGPVRVAILANIWAHAHDRGPRVSAGGDIVVANNLIYNYEETTMWMLDGNDVARHFNFTGNAIIGGDNSGAYAEDYFLRVWDGGGSGASIYSVDNRCGDGNSGAPIWTEIQESPSDLDGISLQGSAIVTTEVFENVSITGATYLESGELRTHLVNSAGARRTDRNVVDERIIADVLNDTGGLIDTVFYSNTDCRGADDPVGCCTGAGEGSCIRNAEAGWPVLTENTIELSIPSNPHGDEDGNGYTNLEEWLHDEAQNVEGG